MGMKENVVGDPGGLGLVFGSRQNPSITNISQSVFSNLGYCCDRRRKVDRQKVPSMDR